MMKALLVPTLHIISSDIMKKCEWNKHPKSNVNSSSFKSEGYPDAVQILND